MFELKIIISNYLNILLQPSITVKYMKFVIIVLYFFYTLRIAIVLIIYLILDKIISLYLQKCIIILLNF
jgi:hypothetical protein